MIILLEKLVVLFYFHGLLNVTGEIKLTMKYSNAIADTVFLFRPTLMIPVWTILMLGWITGAHHSLFSLGNPEFWLLFVAFTAVVGYIYILNQIADIEGDRKNGKLFILPGGHLPVPYAWFLAILSASAGIGLAVAFLDTVSVVLLAIGVILGWVYSFGPSLKDRPWGGLWGNWLGHGVVTYLIGWYGANYGCSSEELVKGVVYSLCAGFANGAVYLTSTIPDVSGDLEVGKRTFAVVYGAKKTALTAAIFCTISALFSLTLPYHGWVMIFPAVMSTVLFWQFALKSESAHSFVTFRWPVLFLSAMTTFYIPLYAILVFAVVGVSHVYYKKRFNLIYPSFTSE